MAHLRTTVLVLGLVLALAPSGRAGEDDEVPLEAMRAYFAGAALLEEGHPDRAVLRFKEALAAYPRYTHALFDRGRAYQAMGLTGKATEDYSKTLDLDPRHAGALRKRATLRYEDGDYAPAMQDLTRLLELEPENVDALHLRARALTSLRNFKGAIADLERAIAIAPRDVGLHYRRGLVHAVQGKVKEAVQDFARVTTLDPQRASGWHMLGVMQAAEGQIAPALEAYDQALLRAPDRADTHAAKAAAFATQGLWVRTLSSLMRAQQLDPSAMHNVPDSALLRAMRAVVWMNADRLAQADVTLEIAVLLDATAVRPRLLRWAIAAQRGQRTAGAEALRIWLDGREEEPDDPALDRIARFLTGRVQENVLLKRAGVGAAVWFYVGLQHEAQGETKAARTCLEKCALATPPRCPEAHLAKEALKRLDGSVVPHPGR